MTAESDAGMAFVAETRSQHERRRTIGVRLLPSTSGLWKHDIPERSARRHRLDSGRKRNCMPNTLLEFY